MLWLLSILSHVVRSERERGEAFLEATYLCCSEAGNRSTHFVQGHDLCPPCLSAERFAADMKEKPLRITSTSGGEQAHLKPSSSFTSGGRSVRGVEGPQHQALKYASAARMTQQPLDVSTSFRALKQLLPSEEKPGSAPTLATGQ